MAGFYHLVYTEVLDWVLPCDCASINHTGWILTALTTRENLWLVYFIIYSTLALTVVSAIKLSGTSFINQTIITNKDTTSNKIYNVYITIIPGRAPSIPWVSTRMNCYPSNNYKQHGSASNSWGSNIIVYPILLPKNLLLKLYNFEHRNKMKLKAHKNKSTKNISAIILSSISLTGIAACTIIANIN